MQRSARTLAILAALVFMAETGRAQDFDWLFGRPDRTPRHSRSHPFPHPAQVPLPPPRPTFASDAHQGAATTSAEPAGADRIAAGAAIPPSPPDKSAVVDREQKQTDGKVGHDDSSTSDARGQVDSKSIVPRAAPGGIPLPPEKPDVLKPAKTPVEDAADTAPSSVPIGKDPAAATAGKSAVPSQPAAGTPLPPPKPAALDKPEPTSPPVAASGATTAFDPRQPESDIGCPARLNARHIDAEPVDIGKQPDERCTVAEPVRLKSLVLRDGGTITFPDSPTIACTTADAFSAFVADLLSPLAKGTYGTPVAAVWTGPGLECRSRDHIFGAKLSAHGQGLAVDIAQIKLGDNRIVRVGDPRTDADQAFETAARAGGCGYFHTALGPGTDSYHRTHWHFDLEVRGSSGDGKYCK